MDIAVGRSRLTATGLRESDLDWDPAERDAWVADAERWIGQIKGVLQSKIDLDDDGQVTGVHVVSGMEREPRHIVRDVEGLLKARLDLDVYYKKIGVVQVVDNGVLEDESAEPAVPKAPHVEPAAAEPEPAADFAAAATATAVVEPLPLPVAPAAAEIPPLPAIPHDPDQDLPLPEPRPAVLVAEGLGTRVVCRGVGVMASDALVEADVTLAAGRATARAVREAPNHAGSDVRLVAEATLAALNDLILDPLLLHLREVRLDTVGGRDIVLVAVDLVEGRRTEVYFGSCAAGHNRQQAVVHAVLDALNRRLSLLPLREDDLAAEES